MKKVLMMAAMAMSWCAMADTEVVDGIEWTYEVNGGKATIVNQDHIGHLTAIPQDTTGAVTIPSALGGCPVTSIGDSAFWGCSGLTSVTIPSSVTRAGCAGRVGQVGRVGRPARRACPTGLVPPAGRASGNSLEGS